MPQLPLPPEVFPAQGFRKETNAQTPHQVSGGSLDVLYSAAASQSAYSGQICLSVDSLGAYPFVVGRGGRISRIAFEVTVGGTAGSVARVGIYKPTSKTNIYPGELVVDGGEHDTTSAGVKITGFDFGLHEVLEAGLYWFAGLVGVAVPTLRVLLPVGVNSILGVPPTFGAAPYDRLIVDRAYGALPETFPAGATPYTVATAQALLVAVRYSQ